MKTLNKMLNININEPLIIAGPCAIENEEQIIEIAEFLKKNGVNILRGGAFKPRTDPNAFQGLGSKGLELLKLAKEKTGMMVVTEVMDIMQIEEISEVADILQIGSRNMFNYSLLKEIGKCNKPVILKRSMSARIFEWIKAAEYISKYGNDKIIFCERGIRSFETYTRNTLDLAVVPIIKKETGLPIIVDPSHGTGVRELVEPMACAALACGADGIMIEIHPNPEKALSDGIQSLNFSETEHVISKLKEFHKSIAV